MAEQGKADRFRKLAAKLRAELGRAKDPAMRKALAELAEQYERLADWVERHS